MITQLEAIKAKSARIAELKIEQMECAKEALIIAKKGASKYPAVTLKRCFRVMGWALKARQIQVQIELIMVQPIPPDFDNGGVVLLGQESEAIIQPPREVVLTRDQLRKWAPSAVRNIIL